MFPRESQEEEFLTTKDTKSTKGGERDFEVDEQSLCVFLLLDLSRSVFRFQKDHQPAIDLTHPKKRFSLQEHFSLPFVLFVPFVVRILSERVG
jgi:hypothetical protein